MVEIRPIRDDTDHAAAIERIEALWGAASGSPEGDELDVLVDLVKVYEAGHHAIEAPDPIALLHHVMEARGLKPADLQPYIGGSGRVSEILNRKRALTLPMIRQLHTGLGLPTDALIRDYELQA